MKEMEQVSVCWYVKNTKSRIRQNRIFGLSSLVVGAI